jgi:hypothetical protein
MFGCELFSERRKAMFCDRNATRWMFLGCLVLAGMVLFGCADIGDITGPSDSAKVLDQPIVPPAGLNLLRYAPVEGLAKTVVGDIDVEGLFEPGEDLKLKLGEVSTLAMMLKIGKDALSEETKICMALPAPGTVMGEFGPHGTTFLEPVKWTVESIVIDVAPEDVDNLQCLYWNPDIEDWEPVGGEAVLDGNKLTLTCWIDHFSRYAWGSAP